MKTKVQTAATELQQSVKAPPMSAAARNAWVVNFAPAQPKGMPSDRLKARAELVRNALSSGTY
ncbi:hypothetical protein [Variovorax terrae]|uniref:Uncharacterized protein n=1 Tax=Variovorax terrae TaxID=2923278 RepID=A0A9X1VWY5_9BURK|nr:hypothetical protein [Variovorax terrae]MCJ0764505.1 hypothetical protein [Variovorax terrae]